MVFADEEGEGVWNTSPLHRRHCGFVIHSCGCVLGHCGKAAQGEGEGVCAVGGLQSLLRVLSLPPPL